MNKYLVWDALNADESDAKEILAEEAYDAAIAYAEQDRSGREDGLYTQEGRALDGLSMGQPITVRDPTDGALYHFNVGIISFDPVYDAEPVE
jgi:hypothetical protein